MGWGGPLKGRGGGLGKIRGGSFGVNVVDVGVVSCDEEYKGRDEVRCA